MVLVNIEECIFKQGYERMLLCSWIISSFLSYGSFGVQKDENSEDRLTGKVVFAINAGGAQFVDTNGIFYEGDACNQGVSSDYGKRYWTFGRVEVNDVPLYQTERYSEKNFGYDIPIHSDGSYVLVLKFSEVYFLNKRKKIFDVVLNKRHIIVKDLDIFAKVGHATAYEEIIPFTVTNKGKTLNVMEEESGIRDKLIKLEFVKGKADNPKINGFYVIKGTESDVPKLPELEIEDDENDEESHDAETDESDWEEVSEKDVNEMDSEHETLRTLNKARIEKPKFNYNEINQENSSLIQVAQITSSLALGIVTTFFVYRIVVKY